jgi:hypothetical protein
MPASRYTHTRWRRFSIIRLSASFSDEVTVDLVMLSLHPLDLRPGAVELAEPLGVGGRCLRVGPRGPEVDDEHPVGHGYVERVPDPDDGRAKLVRATARGQDVYALAREIVSELEREWTDLFGERKMRELRALLEELNEALGTR